MNRDLKHARNKNNAPKDSNPKDEDLKSKDLKSADPKNGDFKNEYLNDGIKPHDDLKLLVEWSSPWHEFRTAIRPALSRSQEPLGGEAPTGLVPYRGMLVSWVLEALLLLAAIILPSKLASMRPYQPPPLPKYDVIYFSGDELPQTEDQGGAKAGKSGQAGGHQAHHHTQIIRVARGDSSREKVVDAPKLDLPKSDAAVANLLAYKPVPGPAPVEGLRSSLRAPALDQTAVPPTPEIQRDQLRNNPTLMASVVAPTPDVKKEKLRTAPAMSAPVVPPSPNAPQRDITSTRIPGSQVLAVIPPPVSAPEQTRDSHSRLTLPPPSVVAPPPTQVARDMKSMGPGFGAGELQKQVVPPPAQVNSVSTDIRRFGGIGSAAAVPPPVQLNGAPTEHATIASLGNPGIVPPPVQVGSGSLSNNSLRHSTSLGGGSAVVPPPPTISGGGSALGHGNRGAGLGNPGDAASLAAPPANNGGSGGGTGFVVSSQPGSKVAIPGNVSGSLAVSPAGGPTPGLGGSGGGSGINRGPGSASGLSGDGTGATKAGTGHGSDTAAHAGISPYPGSSGAGSGTTGNPPMPGVSVQGGNSIITLPSFGGDGNRPSDPARSTVAKAHLGPAITIVGTSRSGGAFNLYGALKGDKVYTIYIDTALGTAVMEYADPASANHPSADDLTPPQPMRADLPANLKRSRLVIACVLDREGALRGAKVLDGGGNEMTTKVLAALPGWKFHPVFRGDQPVEVNVLLGFDIDTR